MTPLRQRLIDELARRNYARRTIDAYVAAVARTARHFNCPPDQLTAEQLRDYQLHLISQDASWSRFNQAACALRFFYRCVLDRPDFVPFVVYARKSRSLPVVLAPEEVQRLFDAVPSSRYRLMLRIAYGCGLRVSEVTRLRIADVDSARRVLWVRQGKGNKDRGVPLPGQLLEELRAHWRLHRPSDWLFSGPTGRPLCPATLARVVQKARRACGLAKHATVHTLRHCYATHLLEAGTDLPTLQRLLGHSNLSSTLRYLHLRAERLPVVQSPLELLAQSGTSTPDGKTSGGTGRRGSGVPADVVGPLPPQPGSAERAA